ncbi:putative lipase domain protein [Trypanosoma grayi]|uniref:putative lipase domain protein n=1 Tax=Trypanosoma grayi TaxID=71804 RepID=UPI0004F457A6|nr:putative lipase domain protein [Trypanosoma grayi]KEG12155.1 putative lipase domain protein [Trypanosoma grayi]
MPALNWFGRKWRTSSDDFTYSGIIFAVILIVNGILVLTRFGGGGGSTYMPDCPKATERFAMCVFALGVIDIIDATVFLVTAVLSCRGGPFQVSQRRLVPYLLYVTTAVTLGLLGLCCAVTRFALYGEEISSCGALTRHFLHTTLVFNFFVPLCYIIMLAIAFDPSGRHGWNDTTEYESLWKQRCRLLCCRCFQAPREKDAFQDVARTLTGLFRGYDIVPSDVVAGMLLVHGMQRRALRLKQANLRYPSAGDGRAERISLQARRFPLLTEHQRKQVAELHSYSKFYMSAYGWPLYEYTHCCVGLPKLFCFDPLMSCRQHPGIHKGTTFYCDVTALLKVSGISDDDIILTSWDNTLFRPVFFVVIDRCTNAVVVAIRGTMSFADCITDLVAVPEVLQIPAAEQDTHSTSDDYYVHGGMKHSAEYVMRELQQSGILNSIIDGELKNLKVVVLGHSLGAGVATILSIMLHAAEPELRSRLHCLAYAPPGGLLSPALVVYSKSFVTGCFAGNDVIPRMASHTFDTLRETILDALMNSTVPKSLLFMNILRTEKMVRVQSHSSMRSSLERHAFRDDLRQTPYTPLREPKKLFPPATLVHFCKAVVRGKCMCCTSTTRSFCSYEEVFVPAFETPTDVQVVMCSPSMFGDHFPDRLFDVIEETTNRLESGELERFFFLPEGGSGEGPWLDYGSTFSKDVSDIV